MLNKITLIFSETSDSQQGKRVIYIHSNRTAMMHETIFKNTWSHESNLFLSFIVMTVRGASKDQIIYGRFEYFLFYTNNRLWY